MNAKPAKPISAELRRELEVRAYLIWESEGKPHGREKEHWSRAEAEILGAKPAKKAASAKTNGVAKAAVAAKAKKTAKTAKPQAAHHKG